MMSGEQFGIAQEPQYRTAYVNSWTNALKNAPAGGSGPRPSMRSECPTGCSGREGDRTPVEGRADGDRAAGGEPMPAQPRAKPNHSPPGHGVRPSVMRPGRRWGRADDPERCRAGDLQPSGRSGGLEDLRSGAGHR